MTSSSALISTITVKRMEQVTTAPKEQEGGTAERNPPETLEEHHKIAILPGILPPKIGSESSGSSSASAPPHVPQAAMASVHSQVPIPASGFDPVQAVPRSGSPEFVPIAAAGGPAAAMPQGILPPPSGESSVATSYAGHDPYQHQSVRQMYDSSANQAQYQWQQFTMGHPLPNAYPLYTPPSYEIGTDYAAASYPAHVASGGYHYGANVQPQTAYPQLYDPSYQLRQNQRLTAAGYGQYARSQRQDRGQVGDYAQFDREGGDRGRRKRSEDPESARDPGPPIGNHLRGPDGANLFVFHIPNTMTNQDLYRLFSQYGNVLSATIKTEAKTGRGRGFGFVNFDTTDAASRAIHHLNGAAINGKHLKVQHKRVEPQFPHQDYAGYPTQDYAGGSYEYAGSYPIQQYQHGYESQGTPEPPDESSQSTPVLSTENQSEIEPRSDDDAKPAAEQTPKEDS